MAGENLPLMGQACTCSFAITTAGVDTDQTAICAGDWKRLGNKRTTNLPMMPERINHAAESPTVFLPYRDDL
jgi:hypothetical protein